MKRLSPALVVGLVALFLGWLFDFLFYGKPLGANAFIFLSFLTGGLFFLAKWQNVRFIYRHLWLFVPLFFFAIMLIFRANFVLSGFNTLAILSLLGVVAFFFATENLERLGVFGYPIILLITFAESIAQPAKPVGEGIRTLTQTKGRWKALLPYLRGVLFALPVLAVFTILLSSADSIFADITSNLFKFKLFDNFEEFAFRGFLILAIAWGLMGAYLFALRGNKTRGENLPGTLIPGRALGFTEVGIVLGLVNLLFLAFTWIQVNYLFNPDLLKNMGFAQYRDYVRRGFGELIFAAVLTMLLLLGTRWLARFDKPWHMRAFNLLCSLMIMLAGLLLLSAFVRMVRWEEVEYYINTPIRMYVRSFMLWLAILFGWLAINFWRNMNRFAIGLLVVIIGFGMTINLVNPDADVASYNINQYKTNASNSDLAYRYLYELSEDAVPALVTAYEQTEGLVHERIRTDLSRRLWRLDGDKGWQEWSSFNYSRWQAYEMLLKLRDQGKLIPFDPNATFYYN